MLVVLYSRLHAPLHSAIDSGEHEKYLFLPLNWNIENSLAHDLARFQDWLVSEQAAKGWFLVLPNILLHVGV